MSDWGVLDMPAALAWLAERFPRLPLVTVGHSVGGQLIGCMPNQARARAHLMLATSTGYCAGNARRSATRRCCSGRSTVR